MSEIFAIGPTEAIRTLRQESIIAEFYKTLVARHAHERPDTDAEDAALEDINRALAPFAPTVRERWQRAIPALV